MPTILRRGEEHPAFPLASCSARRSPERAWTPDFTTDAPKFPLLPIVLIPMPDGTNAVLSDEGFTRVMAGGFSDQFFIHDNGHGKSYVVTSHPNSPSKVHNVARIVVVAGQGERVRYNDHDRRNLLESNLRVGEGYSKGHEAKALRTGPVSDEF